MINAEDFQCEPAFQFLQCHHCPILGIITVLLDHIREGRAWNEMDAVHERADQAFNMSTNLRTTTRAIRQPDPILVRAALESFAMKLLSIIGFDPIGKAADRPWQGN